ncbi:dihydrolipoyl dehydrogenase family protein [Alkalicoccus urumqiensis]|nr:NAD(P)/FAD-dependent oxidoreductase [Alkalicoccus urumqiensis]
MTTYDLIVIGGGSAGLTAASGAAQFGARTALIDKHGSLGGDCLHYGCVPSKALIAAATEVHNMKRNAEKHGFHLEGSADWQRVRSQIQYAVDTIQEHDSTERFASLGVDIYYDEASFEDAQTVRLADGRTLKAKRILISTGSSPVTLPLDLPATLPVITNESLFYLEELPKKIIMIGGGAIGLEMAQALTRLGSEVIVVDRAHELFEKEDREIAERAGRQIRKEVPVYLESEVTDVTEKNGTFQAAVSTKGDTWTTDVDAVFFAVGRKPNTSSLGLERAGVETDGRGYVLVNDRMQSSVESIYAAGDVTGRFPFTHGAGEEAKIVVSNAVFGLKRSLSYENFPWCFYTQPEIFHLGMTEVEAREAYGSDYEVIRASDADRLIAEQDDVSFVKVILSKNGKILGAHGIGANASDWMQTLVYVKAQGEKLTSLSSVVHPYPARTEIVKQLSDTYLSTHVMQGKLPKVTEKYIQYLRR